MKADILKLLHVFPDQMLPLSFCFIFQLTNTRRILIILGNLRRTTIPYNLVSNQHHVDSGGRVV
ncbi:unnamed protein product [Schistosoma haematobium]|nr:unnamed protein product [Schistosoma haematobium]